MAAIEYGKVTAEQARALVKEFPARQVAEGEQIDEREAVPWTWHLGPFGSWPVTMADVEKAFEEHADSEWFYGESIRLGPVVCWETGWGFHAIDQLRPPYE